MNVTTEIVGHRDLHRRIRTVGSLDYDQDGMVTVTTRYPGFVEKVYVDYIGQPVRGGEPLFEVYSPELVQTQRDLLSAVSYADSLSDAPEDVRRRAEELVSAARTRLEYWELTEEQIHAIERDGTVHRTVTVLAPASGVVMKRTHGLEGIAIQPGMDVMHIADLDTLLLTVEVFEDQLQWVTVGMPAKIDITYVPGETIIGRVRYMEPELEERTRTVRLTIDVPNRGGRLRVGMYATVVFEPVAVHDAVAVPSQAVLRTGERNIVVIALGDGHFAPREILLGVEGDDGYVQVVDGLTAGDDVVTSAQFLIDSESNLRAAIQSMNGAAGRSAAEHRH
jgi:RND family efflux transporter MFP subunit